MEYCHEQEQISEQYFQFWSKCDDFHLYVSIPILWILKYDKVSSR